MLDLKITELPTDARVAEKQCVLCKDGPNFNSCDFLGGALSGCDAVFHPGTEKNLGVHAASTCDDSVRKARPRKISTKNHAR
jgi:hypothetical protein